MTHIDTHTNAYVHLQTLYYSHATNMFILHLNGIGGYGFNVVLQPGWMNVVVSWNYIAALSETQATLRYKAGGQPIFKQTVSLPGRFDAGGVNQYETWMCAPGIINGDTRRLTANFEGYMIAFAAYDQPSVTNAEFSNSFEETYDCLYTYHPCSLCHEYDSYECVN